jgi:hypothetical protein
VPPVPPDYELITTALVTSTVSQVTLDVSAFTSEYKHLQIRGVGRVSSGTTIRAFDSRFNGDSGTNYNGHIIIGEGASVYSGGSGNTSNASGFYVTGGGNSAGAFGGGIIDIFDAFSTTKFKTVRSLGGQLGYNIMSLGSSTWRSTNPITSIQLYPQASESWAAGTRFSIYGIRG